MISYNPIMFINLIYIFWFFRFSLSLQTVLYFSSSCLGRLVPSPQALTETHGCFPRRSVFSCALYRLPAIGGGEGGRNGAGGAVPSLLPWQGQKQAHPGQGHTQLPRPAPTPLLTYSLNNLKGLKAANCILEFPSGAFCELAMQETKNYRKT